MWQVGVLYARASAAGARAWAGAERVAGRLLPALRHSCGGLDLGGEGFNNAVRSAYT